MSAELRLQNLNDSTTYPLGLNPSLVKLLMFIEDRPRTKAELLRKGFSGEQVSGLLEGRRARLDRLGRIQVSGVGEASLTVAERIGMG